MPETGIPEPESASRPWRGSALRALEVDLDVLFGMALSDLGRGRQRPAVGVEQLVREEAARPQPPRFDDVDLGGEDRQLGADVEPGEQPEDEGEDAVERAGALERVIDVVAAEVLQQLPEDGG